MITCVCVHVYIVYVCVCVCVHMYVVCVHMCVCMYMLVWHCTLEGLVTITSSTCVSGMQLMFITSLNYVMN